MIRFVPRAVLSARSSVIRLRTALQHVRSQYQRQPQNRSYSSVSPAEISHFNALAATWWDPNGSSRLLHLMNPLRHDFLQKCHASQHDPLSPAVQLSYLDIGCGGGIFTESAARLTSSKIVTGIDPSPAVLEIAKAHAKRDPGVSSKLTYLETTIEDLAIVKPTTDTYDVVSLFEVIEHVTNPPGFLDHVIKHVKPGGWLIMSTIARTWTSWLVTKIVAEDIARIVPRGTHDWNKYINEDELRGYFTICGGFSSPQVMGVMYIPGFGWREVGKGEQFGNYFFGIRKDA